MYLLVWLVLDSYKPHAVVVPKSMQDATVELRNNDGDNEIDNFYALEGRYYI